MTKQRIWIFVADSRNRQDLRDLDHFDGILWGSNPNTRKGDLVLIYRTSPFKDLAYLFTATSDARPKTNEKVDMKYVIDLGNKVRLKKPITLDDLRKHKRLRKWTFARTPQGIMMRRKDLIEEGIWKSLKSLLLKQDASLLRVFEHFESGREGGPLDPNDWKTFRTKRRPLPCQLRVFLSYSHTDLPEVLVLYSKLKREKSVNLWFDKKSLAPADDWKFEIARAINASDMVIICLSANSLKRRGYSLKEIKWALEKADQQPENSTTILPVKLEPCNVPKRLARAQYAELFRRGGYSELVIGLWKQAKLLKENGRT